MRVSFRVSVIASLTLATTLLSAQSWQNVTAPLPKSVSPSAPILLSDGSVLVHNSCGPDWYKLTPDSAGSYVNGSWSTISPLPKGYAPLYFGSAVLPDGRLVIEGGEYNAASGNACKAVWTTQGAIYDPVANSWTSVAPPSGWSSIGDAWGGVLANGTYLQTNCCSTDQALLDPATLTWTTTGAGKFDVPDEEPMVMIPGGNLLTVDGYVFQYDASGTNSEIYNAASGTWPAQAAPSCNFGTRFLMPVRPLMRWGRRRCARMERSSLPAQTAAGRPIPRFTAQKTVTGLPVPTSPRTSGSPTARPARCRMATYS